MKTAFLFPGQGSQKIGMGLDLYQDTEIGKKYFDRANEIMELDLTDIILNGPLEKLTETQFTQPAIYLISVILGTLICNTEINPSAVAGHSLGEYSALTIAGSISFDDGFELVKIRGESMQKAGEIMNGTMAAIIGLDKNSVVNVCNQVKEIGVVVPANFNAPGQIVISGEIPAVESAMKYAKDLGARLVRKLNVSGAFHSPLMASAKDALIEKIKCTEIAKAKFPVYCNVTAKPILQPAEIKKRLIQQLDRAVLWQDTVINIVEDKITKMIEIGPGRVLQGLNKRINPTIISSGIETNIDVNSYANE